MWCPFSSLKLRIGFRLNVSFSVGLRMFYGSFLFLLYVRKDQVQEKYMTASSGFALNSRRMIIYTGN